MRSRPGLPDSDPFSHDGGRIGVLVSHGYTGSPQAVRGWAGHLAKAGHTVRLPLLPGHGTRWQDLNRTNWQDWYGELRRAYQDLDSRCDVVFVAGLSMGGLLVTKVALDLPDTAGLILVNPIYLHTSRLLPFVPSLSRVLPSVPGLVGDIMKEGVTEVGYTRNPLRALRSQMRLWEQVAARLDELRMPVLLMHSAVDHVVPPASSRYFLDHVGSADVTEIVLENSYHVATLDNDAGLINDETEKFIARVARGGVGRGNETQA